MVFNPTPTWCSIQHHRGAQSNTTMVFNPTPTWNVTGSFAVFLASFGTLSAIRYFRRQVREGRPRT
uniref:Uncharacterized protein n=1 Tax=Phasianus colchicus TaxID=9054 RepID=A0A669R189_PHACC